MWPGRLGWLFYILGRIFVLIFVNSNMDYDKILSEAGSAGFYQITVFIFMGLVNSYVNLENLAVNFLNPFHEHWCHVPTPDNANISYDEVSDRDS